MNGGCYYTKNSLCSTQCQTPPTIRLELSLPECHTHVAPPGGPPRLNLGTVQLLSSPTPPGPPPTPPLLTGKVFSLFLRILHPHPWLPSPFFLPAFPSCLARAFPPDLLAQKASGTKPLSLPVWLPSSLSLPSPQSQAGRVGSGGLRINRRGHLPPTLSYQKL